MAADVRSIAGVTEWRADLINYGDSLAEAMAGVNLEIRRAFDWLDEQQTLWKRAVRDCEDEVTRAKAELSQRNFQTWDGRQPDCTVQEKALRRAKARLEYAEEKVETVRRWIARLPKLIDEAFTGPSRRLCNILEADLPVAATELGRRIAALESYAGLRADYAPTPSASAARPTPPAPLPEGKGEKETGVPNASAGARSSDPTPQPPPPKGEGEQDPRAPETSNRSSNAPLTPPSFLEKGVGGLGSSPPPEETP